MKEAKRSERNKKIGREALRKIRLMLKKQKDIPTKEISIMIRDAKRNELRNKKLGACI